MTIDLQGKRVLVVGLGRSGVAAARLCAARGARVTVTDSRGAGDLGAALASLPAGVEQALGGHPEAVFTGADLIVLSPGVPEIPALRAARTAGVAITGEMELASRFVSATLVAITGTNGKSTTTTLSGAILAETGRPTFVGGNLGQPLAEVVGTPAAGSGGICVVEASSFQLETVETFRARVAVLLNITADHFDRHDGLEGYAAAKARIFHAQQRDDFAVVNADDPLAMRVSEGIVARRVVLSTQRRLTEGGWIDGESLVLALPGGDEERYPAQLPALTGKHNQSNALAALVAGRLAGAKLDEARRGLLAFRALPHRMELVAEANGVAYFDDSKGTNVGAVVAALAGFPRPVVLIAGGRDKGQDFTPLAPLVKRRVAHLVLIGEGADRIGAAWTGVPASRAGALAEAVDQAFAAARAGASRTVLFSPGCASFDMFQDYEDRGRRFKDEVARVRTQEAHA
jgi:UDP-N-acetylmuramoylalanine--D-glutamate ligase